MNGYAGKLLRVDLSSRKLIEEPLPEDILRKYVGGRGIAAEVIFREVPKGTDPLSPENKLIFLTGPITGVPVAGNSRYIAAAKSPLTGIWGEGTSGGFFGAEMKRAGFDGFIFEGAADSPVCLWVEDGVASLRSAADLWGLTTSQTEELLHARQNGFHIACIGPAGENLARIACIINDSYSAVGRTGLGAVMGSKKLKVIVVRGKGKVSVSHPERLKELTAQINESLKKVVGSWRGKYGTSYLAKLLNATGELPTKNFQQSFYDRAEEIMLSDKYEIESKSCFACPLGCKKLIPIGGKKYKSPEFETEAAFGSLCMNPNFESLVMANTVCNDYGVDTVSAGCLVAFCIESFEHGLLTEKDTDGIRLAWGDSEGILKLLEKIVKREGIGAVLSEGVKSASEKLGNGARPFAMHVKGLELPMHTVQNKKGTALSFATSVRGACHMQAAFDFTFEWENSMPDLGITKRMARNDVEGKPFAIKATQDWGAVINTMVVCRSLYASHLAPSVLTQLYNAITDMDASVQDLLRVGERVNNLCRAYSVREAGIGKKNDSLPHRFAEPLDSGPAAGHRLADAELEGMLAEYYALRGWDENGAPTKEKLVELDLEFAS